MLFHNYLGFLTHTGARARAHTHRTHSNTEDIVTSVQKNVGPASEVQLCLN